MNTLWESGRNFTQVDESTSLQANLMEWALHFKECLVLQDFQVFRSLVFVFYIIRGELCVKSKNWHFTLFLSNCCPSVVHEQTHKSLQRTIEMDYKRPCIKIFITTKIEDRKKWSIIVLVLGKENHDDSLFLERISILILRLQCNQ